MALTLQEVIDSFIRQKVETLFVDGKAVPHYKLIMQAYEDGLMDGVYLLIKKMEEISKEVA